MIQMGNLILPKGIQDFEGFALKLSKNARLSGHRSSSTSIDQRALTFVDRSGELTTLLLNHEQNHNLIAEAVLTANDDLFLLSAENLCFDLKFNQDGMIYQVTAKPSGYVSTNFSTMALGRMAPAQLRPVDRAALYRTLFHPLPPSVVALHVAIETDSAPPPVRSMPMHMLK